VLFVGPAALGVVVHLRAEGIGAGEQVEVDHLQEHVAAHWLQRAGSRTSGVRMMRRLLRVVVIVLASWT
jgi:hypothetical protein